ncbi:amino acid permease [Oribacterium sp. C9]|uniref:APC family permease n=1 Tax=Oribacterium sp. C9 TaxID=1943579 RepID=UPI00098F9E52|nr:APC family permease [Oribacterium sp. C9]OON86984.1 amino acid permease [Oribacterium sp. C9]
MSESSSNKLGLFNIFSLGVGGAIGSGIFVMMGFGIAHTGRSIVLAVSIGCIYMLLAYLFQPLMASMFVLPGGDYDMKCMLLGPTMSGFAAIYTVVQSLGMGSYGLAFANYFVSVFKGLAPYQLWIAVMLIVLFFALSTRGTKALATITTIITIILLASICLFVVVGIPNVKPGFWSNSDGLFFSNGFTGFISAIAMMSFACQGTTMAPISVMPVTKNARHTIPFGIILITITVGIVYALMGIVAAGVLPVEKVMGQNLSLVAAEIFNPTLFAIFILGAACCAILSSLASGMTMLRYPLVAVAEDGWLPAVFKKTDKNGYPYVVMLLFLVFSIAPLFMGLSIDSMISLTMIPAMLQNAYMNICLIKLVKKYPRQWNNAAWHMPMPVFRVVCGLSSVCALAVAYYLFKSLDTKSMIICVVLLAVMIGLAKIRLMTGAVSAEKLMEKREQIARAAIEATEASETVRTEGQLSSSLV